MKVPILLYHTLLNKELNREKYAINIEEFERQLQYLSENQFQSLLIDDFMGSQNSINRNKKGIVITFDDGNYSDYSIALPILNKYGFVATFFVTVNWITTKNYLDWSHIKEMIAYGMSIQSHSLTHSYLTDLSKGDLFRDLSESKNILEEKLNIPVKFLSIPGGGFFKKCFKNVKKCWL